MVASFLSYPDIMSYHEYWYIYNKYIGLVMLLSHLGKYACELAYKCNSAPIRNFRKKFVVVRKHSWSVHKHSRGLAKTRNMLLKFVRKAYLQHIREQT